MTGWDESAVEDLGDGGKLTKARIEQRFSGGFDGVGVWDGFMYYRPDGTAIYTGIQRMTGAIDAREGSLALLAVGEYDGATADARWDVVVDSGRDDLASASGTGRSSAPHGSQGSYELDVELG